MDLLTPDLIAEVIVGLGAIIGGAWAAFVKLRTKEIEVTHEDREELLRRSGKDLISVVQAWDELEKSLKGLLDETPLDRVLLLRGWNGVRDPDLTTAFYQYKSGSGQYITYDHVSLDRDYKERLRATYGGPQIVVTESLDDSLIKRIYRTEGVLCSVWHYIISDSIEGVLERKTVYCSFASTSVDTLDEETLLKVSLVVDRMKHVFTKFKDLG